MTPQRFRLHNVGSMLGTFGVANLQADPNCVLAQLPDYGVWGLQDFPPGTYTETQRYQWAAQKQVPWLRRNMLVATEDFSSASWLAYGSSPTITKSKTVTDPDGIENNAWRLTITGGAATRGIAQTTSPGFTTYAAGALATTQVWLKVPSGTLSTYISAVTNSVSGRLQCDLTTSWQKFTLENQNVGGSNGSFLLSGGIPDGAVIDIFKPSVNIGPVTSYQPILDSWDATYAALAAAAGFNTGIWQDAGTNPVNTSGQSVYRIADASGKGYTANQATAANRPLWTLDANGKPYLLGDQVNDAMPVTFPASFSSNASVYVTTDAGTTVTDSVTLNGSYAPLVEAKQYARVVFKSGRPTYHEKLIRWLNAKAGL